MTDKPKIKPPRACDMCGATPAPFGFQMPGGRPAQKIGVRPLWACNAQECRDKAEGRMRAATVPKFNKAAKGGAHGSLFDR